MAFLMVDQTPQASGSETYSQNKINRQIGVAGTVWFSFISYIQISNKTANRTAP